MSDNSQQALPVVVVHFGHKPHVSNCLEASAKFNGRIYLVGDGSNAHLAKEISNLVWIDFRSIRLSQQARLVAKHFKNWSTNSSEYELRCFLRAFYTLSLMKELNVDACFHLDSDCALLVDVSTLTFSSNNALSIYPNFGNPLRMAASIHNAYLSREFLEEFTERTFQAYVLGNASPLIFAKRDWHLRNPGSGGICDMTFYYLVCQSVPVQNLGIPFDGTVFDYRFSTGEGHELKYQYTMEGDHKALHRQGQGLWIENTDGNLVRLLSIHFQGDTKKYVNVLSF
ncbi:MULTISPECIES: hypothetical protein [unclassified Bradyrhizobium]